MTGEWMIQQIEWFTSEADAREAMGCARCQVDFLGGRILPPDLTRPQVWMLQAFYEDVPATPTPAEGQWLPDGLRRVWIPASKRAKLLEVTPIVGP